jgi:alkylation response protein AidB-like acyl-CoA dehydrogenase
MNYDLTDLQNERKQALAAWLKQEFPEAPFLPIKDQKTKGEMTRDFFRKLGRLGVFFQTGTNPGQNRISPFSEALTGVLLAGELARWSPSIGLAVEMSTRLFGWLLSRAGTDQQIQEFLVPLQQGALLGAVAMSESSKNFPENQIKTEGRKEKGGFRVTGRKTLVINAPIADCLAVTGQINGQWAVFLIRSGEPGLHIGEPLPTLGFTDLSLADVTLNHCFVPEEGIIGPFPDALVFSELQTKNNLIIATTSLGIMERALQGAQKVAGESQEGRKPLRNLQEIGFKMAEMFTLFQTAQWMLYRAAWLLEANAPEAQTTLAAAKVFITESAEEVARSAMQIAAGEGFLSGNILEECFRDARFGPAAGETSEVLRMCIADDCLAKYR